MSVPRDGCDRSRGSSTVWLLGCVVLLVLGAWCTATLAEVAGLRHRVTDAADEAALAAAAALPATRAVACARAAAVAAQARADLDDCAVEPGGSTVHVAVSRPLPGLLGAAGRARAVARAGPARGPPVPGSPPPPRPAPVWRVAPPGQRG